MSDVMFKKGADLAEVRGVVGHEMGHYTRGHILILVTAFGVLVAIAAFLVQWLFPRVQRLLREESIAGVADPAGLPILMIIAGVLGLLATPALNSITRLTETDADNFSLTHSTSPTAWPRPWSRPASTAPRPRARWRRPSSTATPASAGACATPWSGRPGTWAKAPTCPRRRRLPSPAFALGVGIAVAEPVTDALRARRRAASAGSGPTGRAASSSRRKRNSSAGRPPVPASMRPRPSTRPARSSARRKFCLCRGTPAMASTARCSCRQGERRPASARRSPAGTSACRAAGRAPVARMRRWSEIIGSPSGEAGGRGGRSPAAARRSRPASGARPAS